ncbi:hypothetical protein G3N95_29915 [Paraburkholderia sp. Tr-20389]|uniref:hypothetical protein n=1 Tax=Paraburkholderia sp. Tr-20389 TaxID=2703903 RepID=UPI00197CD60B|nr:hypothetical protein [Paraburkholderia sp. Tr-20389]MBN3757191.1 hypothetical protein [Paraburkholderia sp. Tr-20389]
MTPTEAKDVAEELAAMDLETRRAYLTDLQKSDEEAAVRVKEQLTAIWRQKG